MVGVAPVVGGQVVPESEACEHHRVSSAAAALPPSVVLRACPRVAVSYPMKGFQLESCELVARLLSRHELDDEVARTTRMSQLVLREVLAVDAAHITNVHQHFSLHSIVENVSASPESSIDQTFQMFGTAILKACALPAPSGGDAVCNCSDECRALECCCSVAPEHELVPPRMVHPLLEHAVEHS